LPYTTLFRSHDQLRFTLLDAGGGVAQQCADALLDGVLCLVQHHLRLRPQVAEPRDELLFDEVHRLLAGAAKLDDAAAQVGLDGLADRRSLPLERLAGIVDLAEDRPDIHARLLRDRVDLLLYAALNRRDGLGRVGLDL